MNNVPCRRRSSGERSPFPWRYLLACLIVLLPPASTAPAQPASDTAVVPMYGVGDQEFLLSGYVATMPRGPIDDLWNFARDLGISTLQPALTPEQLDTLAESPLRFGVNGRIILRGLSPLQDAGIGRELQFYPFDSVQSPYYQWKFTQVSAGGTAYNRAEGGARERLYALSAGTAAGDMVVGGIAYDWKPWQTRRFPERPYDTAAQNASGLLDWYLYRIGANRNNPIFHLAVRGHLFAGGTAPATAAILRVEIRYEIPRGMTYVEAGRRATADEDLSRLYATFEIPKSGLMPGPGEPWDRYREISIPIDLARSPDGMPGPLDLANDSRRFDLRLYWTGAEDVALRSIALRDSIGELVLGNGPASVAYRAAMLSAARRALYGPSRAGALRASVIRLMSGIEPHPTEFATNAAIERLLADSLRAGFTPAASIPVHSEGGTTEFGLSSFHALTNADAIFPEALLAPPIDTSAMYGDDLYKEYRRRFGFQVVQVPALREHNGGRFQIPLLAPTAEAIERTYEPVLQIARMGQYNPGGNAWPWTLGNVTRLGEAALVGARTGRRVIATVFTTAELHLRTKGGGLPLDTLMSHTPEAAELRLMANLSLAYGAHGIHYYWLGNYTNHLYPAPGNPNLWIGVNDSWGSNGPFTADTVLDFADPFPLTDNVATPLHPNGTPRVLLPAFWVGYGVRTRELKRLNGWLAQVGPELAKLRWRDAYSMHAAVPGPYIDAGQVRPRPIAPGEIVRGVESEARSGLVDPPAATYVELGLFASKPARTAEGSRDSLRDVQHVFVVNRRAFERPDDVLPATAEGRLLDSLAETRRITVRFALGRPGSWQRNIIRVREVAPDTSRLPLASGPRMPLDTFIQADSAVRLWLRPGGGALLEITYPLADPMSEMRSVRPRDVGDVVRTGAWRGAALRDVVSMRDVMPIEQMVVDERDDGCRMRSDGIQATDPPSGLEVDSTGLLSRRQSRRSSCIKPASLRANRSNSAASADA